MTSPDTSRRALVMLTTLISTASRDGIIEGKLEGKFEEVSHGVELNLCKCDDFNRTTVIFAKYTKTIPMLYFFLSFILSLNR